jgi:serine/threonine-protein kinase HipA
MSLPVREKEYPQASALPFFAGLLPDGDLRRRVAEYLHISETSPLKLLEALGGECAGTVSLFPVDNDDSGPERKEPGGYEEIAREELERMILESDRRPLLVPRGGARLSLAGAQEKIPLLRKGPRWFRPLGGAPSSHILKPAPAAFPDIVFNEFAVLRMARVLGLPVPTAEIAVIGKPVLVVERYDRRSAEGDGLERMHQEDFCQALGIMPDRKYQSDGGPGFADIAGLVKRVCSLPLADLERLIDIAVFNVLIGNCDAHGKNFSLLYMENHIGLAPFYDLVSTTYWGELDTKLSMRFGKTYKLDEIRRTDLEGFARDLGVKPKAVEERAVRLMESAAAAWEKVFPLPELQVHHTLVEHIRCGWEYRSKRLTGSSVS